MTEPTTPVFSTSSTATSADSRDTLPLKGYSIDQLESYIRRQLGAPVWNVEFTKQQVLDCIQTSMGYYSLWRPRIRYGSVQLQRGKFDYLRGVDLGQGPVTVTFVQRLPVPVQLYWGNLIGPIPINFSGMDELDMFMRWQKTWLRVTSAQPDWQYDEMNKVLMIHNPIDFWYCGILCYVNWDKTESLDLFGANWVRDYAFQMARHNYAELLMKYSGAVPGPVKDLQLDQGKRAEAKEQMEKLMLDLKAAQEMSPVSID